MIRLVRDGEEQEEQPPAGEYYVVVSEYATFYVSPGTAARVGRALDRAWGPHWLKFTDVSGARVWVRRDRVETVYESTEEQRARDRLFHRSRRREEAADRSWDEDD